MDSPCSYLLNFILREKNDHDKGIRTTSKNKTEELVTATNSHFIVNAEKIRPGNEFPQRCIYIFSPSYLGLFVTRVDKSGRD